ncbi:DUF3426 domain-containing protein [Acinetobacter tibetensis]|uniref:Zinc-ribbon and DUF3426 domain-containing protein n=1 Tax=Acinetobacter tibetensis TaxID=2943497 RepID=A0AAE9LPE9_9GAMM|nr:DUF3426 domain-containing protein [Acinetobacter tibetensis]USE82181.1 zinc-ribbon and DUF3426 domain-containing protein [Acinetobacter tibetensis]HEX5381045.1 DUF3426 domain-containing protein [Acinetobacter sp.]
MSEKQTSCPECLTIYRVSVAQLTVAQGMVCCPKCSTTFNALTHLINQSFGQLATYPASDDHFDSSNQDTDFRHQMSNIAFEHSLSNRQQLLEIFDRKIEHSNIDLKTYLNNLNYFSTDPIGNFPALNLAEKDVEHKPRSPIYYIMWGIVNIALILLLLFQFFWFNPQYLRSSPKLAASFNQVCALFKCEIQQENYTLISATKVKAKRVAKNKTLFTGELINYYDKSIPLPILKVILREQGVETGSFTLQPKEYLADNLVGIERIPQKRPFKIHFELPVDRKSFDDYSLEIIGP